MNKYKIYFFLILSVLFFSCDKDVLDRPPETSYVDIPGEFWRNEDDIRMFANGFYSNYFTGFNSGFTADYTPVRGYTFL